MDSDSVCGWVSLAKYACHQAINQHGRMPFRFFTCKLQIQLQAPWIFVLPHAETLHLENTSVSPWLFAGTSASVSLATSAVARLETARIPARDAARMRSASLFHIVCVFEFFFCLGFVSLLGFFVCCIFFCVCFLLSFCCVCLFVVFVAFICLLPKYAEPESTLKRFHLTFCTFIGSVCEGQIWSCLLPMCWKFHWRGLWIKVGVCLHRWRWEFHFWSIETCLQCKLSSSGITGAVIFVILLVLLIWMICVRATRVKKPEKHGLGKNTNNQQRRHSSQQYS